MCRKGMDDMMPGPEPYTATGNATQELEGVIMVESKDQ